MPNSDRSALPPQDRLLHVAEVAAYLDIPTQTLYAWRVYDRGPRGIKVGRHLRFRRADVEAWLEQQSDERPPAA